VRAEPRRVVFAEGEDEKTIRAAFLFRESGFGTPVLVGREDRVNSTMVAMGLSAPEGLEIHNARLSQHNKRYTDFLYTRQQRNGMLYRDWQRQVNQDRNVFAACMVACGDADAMVTGVTRNSFDVLGEGSRVIAVKPDCLLFGLTVLLADTLVHEVPSSPQLADIAIQAAAKGHQLGPEPHVALLSYSNFGNPMGEDGQRVRDAVALLDQRRAGFKYDGEMSADVALDEALMRRLYPFCRLTGPANVLVMPELHTVNTAAKLLPHLGRSSDPCCSAWRIPEVLALVGLGLRKGKDRAPAALPKNEVKA